MTGDVDRPTLVLECYPHDCPKFQPLTGGGASGLGEWITCTVLGIPTVPFFSCGDYETSITIYGAYSGYLLSTIKVVDSCFRTRVDLTWHDGQIHIAEIGSGIRIIDTGTGVEWLVILSPRAVLFSGIILPIEVDPCFSL